MREKLFSKILIISAIIIVLIISGCKDISTFLGIDDSKKDQSDVELLSNGDFSITNESDLNFAWNNIVQDQVYGTSASFDYSSGAAKISIIDSSECFPWTILLNQSVVFKENSSYRLEFDAVSTIPNTLSLVAVSNSNLPPWTTYFITQIDLTTSYKTYIIDFTMTEEADDEAIFSFELGKCVVGSTITIDNVSLTEIAETDPQNIQAAKNEQELLELEYSGLIANGDFSSDYDGWEFYSHFTEGSLANVGKEDGYAHVIIFNNEYEGSSHWHTTLGQFDILLEQGKSYQVDFDAWSTAERSIDVVFQENGIDNNHDDNIWSNYGNSVFNIGIESASYSFVFTMNDPTDSNCSINFMVGGSIYDVYFDNVSLVETE